jgi:hypothetical protein
VLLQRRSLLELRQTLTEIYVEPSSRGVQVGPNHTQPLAQIAMATPLLHGHLDSRPLGASLPLCLSAGMGGPLRDTTVLYNVYLEKWPAAHSHNRIRHSRTPHHSAHLHSSPLVSETSFDNSTVRPPYSWGDIGRQLIIRYDLPILPVRSLE